MKLNLQNIVVLWTLLLLGIAVYSALKHYGA